MGQSASNVATACGGESLVSEPSKRISGPAKWVGGAVVVTSVLYGSWQIYLHRKRENRLKTKSDFDLVNDDLGFGIEVCIYLPSAKFRDISV